MIPEIRRSTSSVAMRMTVRLIKRARTALNWSWLIDQAELTEQTEIVEPTPPLHDATLTDTEDLDPAERDCPAVSGHTHDFALLRAGGCELLNDQVVLGDEETDVAVPIWEGGSEHGGRPAHALAVRGCPERRVMVDEVLGEEGVNRSEVSLGE